MQRGGASHRSRRVLALALSLIAVSHPVPAHAAGRVVSGVVVSGAGEAIPDATIVVLDESGEPIATTRSDAAGRWHVDVGAARSGLVARVSVEGLEPTKTPVPLDDVGARDLRTTLGQAEAPSIELQVRGARARTSTAPSQPIRFAVDGELLSRLPGTRGDPFTAVASLPSLARPPALSTVYIVRGGAPEDTATYLDGAPIPHAFHFGGLISIVPAAMIESISVAPGGFGVAYGRATGGIIDAAVASPAVDGVHASLSLDAIDVGGVASAPFGPKTRVFVGARRSHLDAWLGTFIGDSISGDLPRYLDGQAIVEHDITERVRARAGVIAADDSVSVTDPNSPTEKPRKGSWRSGSVRAHVRVDARGDAGESLLAVVAATRSHDEILGELDEWNDARRSIFGRVEGSARVGEGARVTVGGDLALTEIEGVRVLSIPTASFGGSATFAMRGGVSLRRAEPGAYAQLTLTPADWLRLTPGLRVDRAYGGEVLAQPRLALRAALSPETVLRAAGGLYTRPNTFDAVNARDLEGALVPVIFEARPVRSANVGAGIEQNVYSADEGAGTRSPDDVDPPARGATSVDLSVDAYARFASGLLAPVQQPARPIYDADRLAPTRQETLVGYEYRLNTDQGRARAVGLELLLRVRTPRFVGFVAYALGRAELRDTPFAGWRRAPFDQTHVLTAVALTQLGKGWETGARFRLAAGVLDSPYPASEIAPKSDPNVDPNRPLPELPIIDSLDIRVEKVWRLGTAGRISAYVEVRNVYNRRAREPLAYNYVYGYAVVGRGLPIIPNIGVRGSF